MREHSTYAVKGIVRTVQGEGANLCRIAVSCRLVDPQPFDLTGLAPLPPSHPWQWRLNIQAYEAGGVA